MLVYAYQQVSTKFSLAMCVLFVNVTNQEWQVLYLSVVSPLFLAFLFMSHLVVKTFCSRRYFFRESVTSTKCRLNK